MVTTVEFGNSHHVADLTKKQQTEEIRKKKKWRELVGEGNASNKIGADKKNKIYLGVLVGLSTEEWLSVGHGNWLLSTLFQSLEVSEVGLRVDKSSTNGVGVSGDGTDDAATGALGLGHIVQEEVDQEEVSQMVHAHAHLETVVGPGRFGVGGLVNGGVTDQVGQRTGRLEGLQVSNKVTDTLETAELELHGNVGVFGEVLFLGDCEDSKWVKTFWQTHHGQKM